MKAYELTFIDIERGKIKRWKRNKRQIAKFVNGWKRKYPMRKLMLTVVVEIPDDKDGLLDWLNDNLGGAS